MRFVVGEVNGWLHDGSQPGALTRRVFHRSWRQHPEVVDAKQRAEEHSGAGRFVRENQAENPLHRSGSTRRVRVLWNEHG